MERSLTGERGENCLSIENVLLVLDSGDCR